MLGVNAFRGSCIALHDYIITLLDCNSFLFKHLSHTCSCKVYFLLILCRLEFFYKLGNDLKMFKT